MRLSDYPYVVVRLGCQVCKRRGQYRLARLAFKYGPEITLDELIDEMTKDCGWRNDRSPKKNGCRARFIDIDGNGGPPDLPRTPLKLVAGGQG